MALSITTAISTHRHLTTAELATTISLQPQSIRKRYSQAGSYHGVRPVKLPNRRLLWPANAVELLASPTHRSPNRGIPHSRDCHCTGMGMPT